MAAAAVGTGAVLDLSTGTAQASGGAKAGTFASSTAGTPAVRATGTNGADGVDASSDSGTGIKATSTTGTGLTAASSSGLAGHFLGGNVQIDNRLTAGTLSSGAGTFASSTGTPAVSAAGTNNTTGVAGTSDTGHGVQGESSSGFGVVGISSGGGAGVYAQSNDGGPALEAAGFGSGNALEALVFMPGTGLAGHFGGGDVHIDTSLRVGGNLTVVGTKAFVQAHPSDPGKEIMYVALEGGEAGTYVRGTGQLQDGKAVLALPEHFGLVTAADGLTVQLTPRGEWLQLYVAELGTSQLVVREAQDRSGRFDYFISGVRKGHEQHEVIRPKR